MTCVGPPDFVVARRRSPVPTGWSAVFSSMETVSKRQNRATTRKYARTNTQVVWVWERSLDSTRDSKGVGNFFLDETAKGLGSNRFAVSHRAYKNDPNPTRTITTPHLNGFSSRDHLGVCLPSVHSHHPGTALSSRPDSTTPSPCTSSSPREDPAAEASPATTDEFPTSAARANVQGLIL